MGIFSFLNVLKFHFNNYVCPHVSTKTKMKEGVMEDFVRVTGQLSSSYSCDKGNGWMKIS